MMEFNLFQRWLTYWGDLIDGVVGVVSFGLIGLELGFKISLKISKYKAKS